MDTHRFCGWTRSALLAGLLAAASACGGPNVQPDDLRAGGESTVSSGVGGPSISGGAGSPSINGGAGSASINGGAGASSTNGGAASGNGVNSPPGGSGGSGGSGGGSGGSGGSGPYCAIDDGVCACVANEPSGGSTSGATQVAQCNSDTLDCCCTGTSYECACEATPQGITCADLCSAESQSQVNTCP